MAGFRALTRHPPNIPRTPPPAMREVWYTSAVCGNGGDHHVLSRVFTA